MAKIQKKHPKICIVKGRSSDWLKVMLYLVALSGSMWVSVQVVEFFKKFFCVIW